MRGGHGKDAYQEPPSPASGRGSPVQAAKASFAVLVFVLQLSAWSAAYSQERENADVAKLIRQLGSDDFSQRQNAEQRLIDIGLPALAALRTATNDRDAEIALRAQRAIFKITSMTPAEQRRLRADAQVAIFAGKHQEAARAYRRLAQVANASLDDHHWHGHAYQLAGNWAGAVGAYVWALDRTDELLSGNVKDGPRPPGNVRALPMNKEGLAKHRRGSTNR